MACRRRFENIEKRLEIFESFMASQTMLQTKQPTWSGASTGSPDAAFNGKPAEGDSFIQGEASSLASAVDPIDAMGAVAEQEESSVFHGKSFD